MKKVFLLLVLIALGLGGGAYYLNHSPSTVAGEGYTFDTVKRGDLTETINTTGFLQPREVIPVGTELSGRIVKLYPRADYDQAVREGDPLAELDPEMLRATLQQAEAALEGVQKLEVAAKSRRDAAREELETQQELEAKGTGVGSKKAVSKARLLLQAAEAELGGAQSKVKAARADVEKARLALDRTTVRAPAGGVIVDKKVVEGQMIAPPLSGQLFVIATDLSRLYLRAQVAESDINKVRVGQKATFTVYAYSDSDQTFAGTVEQIREIPNSQTGGGAVFYDTLIAVDNRRDPTSRDKKGWMLRPGMTANADIIRRTHPDVWKVPTAALEAQVDEALLSPAAREKLRTGQEGANARDWQTVWILDAEKKPWPVFVRTGGHNRRGESLGISDGKYKEVLEWDPELKPAPDPKDPKTYPQLILTAPAPHKAGFFEQMKLKIS